MRSIFVLTLALALSGCIRHAPDAIPVSTSTDQVRLSAEQKRPGMVLLRLTNGSDSSVGYNLCATSLERQDDTWTQMPSEIICTMELRTLSPGASATYDRELPSAVSPGQYRFRTSVESPLGRPGTGVVSNTVSLQ